MRTPLVATLALAALTLSGCGKKDKKDAAGTAGGSASEGTAVRGLPPIEGGKAGSATPPATGGTTPRPDMGGAADPHAGLDMGGAAGGADPHAGIDMGGGAVHEGGGMDMGGQVADPHAGSGPTVSIEGEIHVDPKLKDQVQKGAVLFLTARNLQTKSIIGVGRVVADSFPLKFKLDAKGGAAGSEKDKVLVTVNVDKDHDPMKKQGELEALGETVAPAKGVKLTIDHVREAP